ncbi:hypothetical protein CcrKarma_gp065 [Caulobacter virus Karma]|uniref:Uncharacterized protein n=1 Tax=Caulobacter phage CcrSwift TaxID=2927984 RepID=K4JVI9_9CAUD|nr:hypothetical protein CcrMagneto_gp062 [Caulobacter virus Magneto]YP_006989445.1 hypothetical protein CcrKarma_gp065 [Caulobacter virus Karma]YP_006989795.1 hypothetical protein D870_gp062 [Caulobacter phage CcrSwift]AFU87232.1 hypothetical protein CcrMagneto_gp062 [Caulobacter virus Magneto]AFU87582.1 hypothetical protein CcrKarma_gp065 [Caulobacter virus Karma]AFU88380.1 hypothetical protein CcrSwift_gp062 [Caulobacter phage CcrSwift]
MMVSGQVGRYSEEALKALTLQASATYEALLDALRVHANNLERLRSLRGHF